MPTHKTHEFLITEVCKNPEWKIIKESSTKSGKLLEVEGRFQYANKKNQNGRIYPHRLLEREINRLQTNIVSRNLFGELDHPDKLETSLKTTSHVITKLWMEGDEVRGRFEILPTPCGDILRGLYESGCQPGVSSRGAGRAIERKGYFEIASDFELRTFDAVSDPSTHDAYPKLLSESQIIRPNSVFKLPNSNRFVSIEDLEMYYLAGL